jgi:enoyl-CoA hydratase/carnithine racemase
MLLIWIRLKSFPICWRNCKDDELGCDLGRASKFLCQADVTEVLRLIQLKHSFSNIRSLFDKIEDFEKPVISAVSGFAWGRM